MKVTEAVKTATSGVCTTVVDLLLWYTYFTFATFGKSGSAGVYKAAREADTFLNSVNVRTLAATWRYLTKKRLITHKKRKGLTSAIITEYGRKRLEEMIPTYQKTRSWDGKLYLVTYDIKEIAHQKRDYLRSFLMRIGCKMLQQSIFLTVYNPRTLLSNFIKEVNIPGTIIVSDIGKDGGIGEKTINDLLVEVYQLESLNERYERFLDHANQKDTPLAQLSFEYLSILKDDPQLPFELLSKHFKAEKAQEVYQKLLMHISAPRP